MLYSQNLHQVLDILNKRMTFIAYAFPKLLTVKYVVRQMHKNPRFRTLFNSQHNKGSQTLLKSAREHFNQISLILWEKKCCKMSLLVIAELLRSFVNTATSYDKNSFGNSENLLEPIQMSLSKKQKKFSQFSVPLLKCTSHF